MAQNSGLLDVAVDNPAHLGGYPSFSTANLDYFRGDMSVLRIYDSALSASDVQQNFDAVMVPEPSAFALFGLGCLALLFRHRRR